MQYSKLLLLVGLFLSVMSCEKDITKGYFKPEKEAIINDTVLKNKLVLKPNLGIVFYKDKPFTGVSILTNETQSFTESITYINGVKNGCYKKWFSTGLLSYNANYSNGKLNGIVKSWWVNGFLRSENNFENGIGQGKQYQFYNSGEKFKELNLLNGKQDGLQKAWRKNGAIYINYEAKNGRTFGLKRANLCYELQKEELVSN